MRRSLTAVGLALLAGCFASSSESVQRDSMPEVKAFPPKPMGYRKVRAAVVDFEDKTRKHRGIGAQAADAMISIVSESDRFSLIERSRLEELMKEQGLEGVVEPSELSKAGRVRGIDYLFLGAVTNFRVKVTRTRSGGGIWDRVVKPIAPLDIDTSKTEVETQVGVDIRLVNTQTGEIVASRTGEVIHKAVASAWGIRVLGIGGEGSNEIRIDDDSRGKILRHALHESYTEILKVTDEKFSRPQASYCPKCKQELEVGKKFCSKCGSGVEPTKCKCGATLEPGARFCGECGAKTDAPK